MNLRPTLLAAVAAVALAPPAAFAGEADVTAVAVRAAAGTYSFDVTVRHADEGWDHYADRWDVVAMDGAVLASRKLLHPHVDEQPFTRSLGGVRIPEGTKQVRVRANDSVHGAGGVELVVDLDTGETRSLPGGQT